MGSLLQTGLALRLPPRGEIVVDLPSVAFEMLGMGLEPLLGRILAHLGVACLARPRLRRKRTQERRGHEAYRRHRGERRLDRERVIVEATRPLFLVVADD